MNNWRETDLKAANDGKASHELRDQAIVDQIHLQMRRMTCYIAAPGQQRVMMPAPPTPALFEPHHVLVACHCSQPAPVSVAMRGGSNC